MKQIIYEVHSDKDENNILCEFDGRGAKQRAIAYARQNREEQTWVDRVIYDLDKCRYEYCCCVWNYEED